MPSSGIILAVIFTSLLCFFEECQSQTAWKKDEKIFENHFCNECGAQKSNSKFKVQLNDNAVLFICIDISSGGESWKLSKVKPPWDKNFVKLESKTQKYHLDKRKTSSDSMYIVKFEIKNVERRDVGIYHLRFKNKTHYFDYTFTVIYPDEDIQKTTAGPGSKTSTAVTCPDFKETKDTGNKHSQDADSTPEENSAPKAEESAIPVSTMIAILAVTFILAVVILGVVCYWTRAKLTNNMRPSEAVPVDGSQQPDMQAAADGSQEQEAGACGGAGADEEDSGRYVTDDGLVYVTVAHAKGKVKPQPGKNGARNETKQRNEDRVEYVTLNYKFIKEQEDKKNSG